MKTKIFTNKEKFLDFIEFYEGELLIRKNVAFENNVANNSNEYVIVALYVNVNR